MTYDAATVDAVLKLLAGLEQDVRARREGAWRKSERAHHASQALAYQTARLLVQDLKGKTDA